MVKKIYTPSSAAAVMTEVFQKDWKGFTFNAKAVLAKTKEVPEGFWKLEASNGCRTISFIWELVTGHAYPCDIQTPYTEFSVHGDTVSVKNENGWVGTICSYRGEIAVVWE